MNKSYDTLIIGAGAAGLMAAISARRSGAVCVCDRLSLPAKKLAATGNGRCNMLNDRLDAACYAPQARELVAAVFDRFGKDSILRQFREMGVYTTSAADGRIFPVTNQAATVVKALLDELARIDVPIISEFCVTRIAHGADGFNVEAADGRTLSGRRLIVATGGKSYPALGSNGSGYTLMEALGHSVVEPVPGGVPLVVKDRFCHYLQGQKITAHGRAEIGGRLVGEQEGDLLFTQYGLSGSTIIDLSGPVSMAINRGYSGPVRLIVDMIPFIDTETLRTELTRRQKRGDAKDSWFTGILPNKFASIIRNIYPDAGVDELISAFKDKVFEVQGTRGWNEAEFTYGGVPCDEVNTRLMSRKIPDLYLCGEILDIAAPRGGYNLAWAWGSGWVAGLGEEDNYNG